jgi:hypothetical protein
MEPSFFSAGSKERLAIFSHLANRPPAKIGEARVKYEKVERVP